MGMERLHLITHLCCQVSTMCQPRYPKHQAVVGREGHEEVTTALESSREIISRPILMLSNYS